jgi:hypothetical protein
VVFRLATAILTNFLSMPDRNLIVVIVLRLWRDEINSFSHTLVRILIYVLSRREIATRLRPFLVFDYHRLKL